MAVFDARYMLEENDGTLILLNNRGFLWGRKPDTMQKLRDWAFEEAPIVQQNERAVVFFQHVARIEDSHVVRPKVDVVAAGVRHGLAAQAKASDVPLST